MFLSKKNPLKKRKLRRENKKKQSKKRPKRKKIKQLSLPLKQLWPMKCHQPTLSKNKNGEQIKSRSTLRKQQQQFILVMSQWL